MLSTVGSVRARRSVAVLLATAAAAGLGIASAGEASAYTCPSSSTRTISDGTFSYGSSNDNPRIWAYVYAANGGPTQSSGASSWI